MKIYESISFSLAVNFNNLVSGDMSLPWRILYKGSIYELAGWSLTGHVNKHNFIPKIGILESEKKRRQAWIQVTGDVTINNNQAKIIVNGEDSDQRNQNCFDYKIFGNSDVIRNGGDMAWRLCKVGEDQTITNIKDWYVCGEIYAESIKPGNRTKKIKTPQLAWIQVYGLLEVKNDIAQFSL